MGEFKADVLVIGAGLTGSVIARQLAEAGKCVRVWDRRSHIAGNMYDCRDEHGILVQKYGPHTFHTKEKELYDYMCRFEEWIPYRLHCGAKIDGYFTPTPFNFKTIDQLYAPKDAERLKEHIEKAFQGRKTATVVEVMESSDELVRAYGRLLFEKDYSLYTAKQWGIPPEQVDPSILRRVPLRFSYEEGYFGDAYQVMPRHSFTSFFEHLLSHENIRVELGVEALDHLTVSPDGDALLLDGVPCPMLVVYTGALDELFQRDQGALPYRSLRFEWKYEDCEEIQPYPVTAYPDAEGYTRITEYKKLPVQKVQGTMYAVEYPLMYHAGKKQEPYYPLLTEESKKASERYKRRAARVKRLYPCGRLADFKYYDMDQALKRALEVARAIQEGKETYVSRE
ncbi:UDP-galactopyranose mutase [uncultured Selenomonas sp.]|uniref:UDP-galactopyranose mutase n=1 Tax=uncultured Selenomonas sp. TaxID=159275 RepID=UPI0025FB4466|nr:UDP-galactopyranose mutase [uncultured Selenomonas sp.]